MVGNNKIRDIVASILLAIIGIFGGYQGGSLYYNRNKVTDTDTIRQVIRIDSLRAQVFYKGDKTSYEELKNEFKENGIPQNIYIYSWIMANKYNYNVAYMDMALSLENTFSAFPSLQPIDSTTQRMIKEYKQKYEGNLIK